MRIEPLGDHVLVRDLKTDGGARFGVVLAVGPGKAIDTATASRVVALPYCEHDTVCYPRDRGLEIGDGLRLLTSYDVLGIVRGPL